MKRITLAVAMALALAFMGSSAGFASATSERALQEDACDRMDFVILDNVQQERTLMEDDLVFPSDEVGISTVAPDIGKVLEIEYLTGDGELAWSVHTIEDGDCEQFEPADCSGTLRAASQVDSCTLDASELRTYFVLFELLNGDVVEYGVGTTLL